MIVTGASDGIGAAAAIELARHGDRVVIVGRSPEKTQAVAERVEAAAGEPVEMHCADFPRLDQVRALGATLAAAHPGLVLEELLSAPRVAVLASTHPLARRDCVAVRELFDEPWIYADTEDEVCRSYWLAMEHRTNPPILGEGTRTIDRFIQLAMAGEVVGLAADWVRTAFTRPGLTFVPVSDVAPATTALGWRADTHNPLVDAFIDIARSVRDAPSS